MKRSNNLPFQLLFFPLSIPFVPLVLFNPLPFALCSLFILYSYIIVLCFIPYMFYWSFYSLYFVLLFTLSL